MPWKHSRNPDVSGVPESFSSGRTNQLSPSAELRISRREKRLEKTYLRRIKFTHKRRQMATRAGVVVAFALSMVVYPVAGNVVSYADSAVDVPGFVPGVEIGTASALLGAGPNLVDSELPLPSVDEYARAMVANATFSLSPHLEDCQLRESYSLENGYMPSEELCQINGNNYLRSDAAIAFAELNAQFKVAFGRDLCIYEGYRDYAGQVAIKRERGFYAASVGRSLHGLGIAFDTCRGDDSGAVKRWLDDNAHIYGFVNPPWAKSRKFEPWHWEYWPAVIDLNWYGGGAFTSDYGDDLEDVETSRDAGATPPPEKEPPTSDPGSTPAPEPPKGDEGSKNPPASGGGNGSEGGDGVSPPGTGNAPPKDPGAGKGGDAAEPTKK